VEDKKAIVHSYGVQSSADMQTHDLIDVCGALQKQLDEKNGNTHKAAEMDKTRKRCLKAICAYIDAKGIKTTDKLAYAKQMACRASKKENFNKLTAAELRGFIGYFNSERETLENAAVNIRASETADAVANALLAGKWGTVGEA
jgi:hypothetical protein